MTITAAADGSALGNPGPCGWAWYIDDTQWAAGGSPHGTNNQGELQAVLELLHATAGVNEKLVIECDSQYVINSVTKWMAGWKRRGWRKADGGPVLNRELIEGIDNALRGRDVEFVWVKGHAGHPRNEGADERANAAARAFQKKVAPDTGPGFKGAASATNPPVRNEKSTPDAPTPEALWSAGDDLLTGLFDEPTLGPIEVTVALTAAEHARLKAKADAQGLDLAAALQKLIKAQLMG